jgi:hypothetical protein
MFTLRSQISIEAQVYCSIHYGRSIRAYVRHLERNYEAGWNARNLKNVLYKRPVNRSTRLTIYSPAKFYAFPPLLTIEIVFQQDQWYSCFLFSR